MFGCVRKLKDADFLVAELGPTRFAAVEMDVCDVRSVYRAAEFVGEALVEGRREESWEGSEGGEEEEVKERKTKNGGGGVGGGGGGEAEDEAGIVAALGGTGSTRKKNNRRSSNHSSNSPRPRSGGNDDGGRRRRAASNRALLSGLVNCAGVAVPGPLLHQPLSEIRGHMEVNFFGASCVTQAFAPLLGAGKGEKTVEKKEAGVNTCNGDVSFSSSSSSSSSSDTPPFSRFAASSFPVSNPGTIVQISSTAGKLSAPFIGAYAASKHALEAASDALRRELIPYKVDVLVIEPGAVATPIWDKAEHHDASAYDGTPYAGPLKVFGEIVRAEGRVSFFEVFLSRYFFRQRVKIHSPTPPHRTPPPTHKKKAGHSPQRIAHIVSDLLDKTQKKQEKELLGKLFSYFSLPPTRTTCVYKRVKNWTLPHLLPDRLSDLIVAALLGMLPGPFFRNAALAAAAAAGKEKTSAAVVVSGGGGGNNKSSKQQGRLFTRHAVAALAFIAAIFSFAWRAAAS